MWTEERVRRYGRVTLVEVTVGNDADRPRRVRITSELDGPVWPPRTRGMPTAEWDGDAIAARIEPGERRSFGFASPARPAEPAVSVTVDEAVTDGGRTTPADVVRALGDPRPPRDALGDPFPSRSTGDGDDAATAADPGPPPAVGAWFDAIAAGIEERESDPAGTDPLPDPAALRAVADRADELSRRLAGSTARREGDRDRRGRETVAGADRP